MNVLGMWTFRSIQGYSSRYNYSTGVEIIRGVGREHTPVYSVCFHNIYNCNEATFISFYFTFLFFLSIC